MLHRTSLLGILLASAHAVAVASDITVELARPCTAETLTPNELTVMTAGPMIEGTGLTACIDKTTRVRLTATGLRTY
jgi:hypothetical protein